MKKECCIICFNDVSVFYVSCPNCNVKYHHDCIGRWARESIQKRIEKSYDEDDEDIDTSSVKCPHCQSVVMRQITILHTQGRLLQKLKTGRHALLCLKTGKELYNIRRDENNNFVRGYATFGDQKLAVVSEKILKKGLKVILFGAF